MAFGELATNGGFGQSPVRWLLCNREYCLTLGIRHHCKGVDLPPRSHTEIIADAEYIAQAAEEEIKSAQRMRASIDAILEAAVNAGEGAVKQATAAGSAA